MLMWSFFKTCMLLYSNLKLIGKILFFPFYIAFIFSSLIMGLFEFILIDIWILLFEILSKDGDVKAVIDFMTDTMI